MFPRAAAILAIASILLVGGGCGTLENLREAAPPKDSCEEAMKTVYGGVRKDCRSIDHATNANDFQVEALLFAALDLPFSLVGDTISLPYTITYETGVFGLNRTCEFNNPVDLKPANAELPTPLPVP